MSDITTKYKNNLQRAVSSTVATYKVGDVTSGTTDTIAKLPSGALVIGSKVVVATAFNAGTSITADVGVTGTATAIADDVDLSTTGVTSGSLTGNYYSTGTSITLVPTVAGTAPTTGEAYIIVEYVEVDKVNGAYVD